MSQPVFLKIYHSGKLVTNRQFVSDQISIGSSADGPSLTLADPSVCFWHALIEKRGGEYHISDLGSPNGTFINAKPILEAGLKHGDQIQIGDFVIQFFIGVPFIRPAPATQGKGADSVQEATASKRSAPAKTEPAQQAEPVSPVARLDTEARTETKASLSKNPPRGLGTESQVETEALSSKNPPRGLGTESQVETGTPSSVTPDPAVIPVKPGIPSKLGTEPQVETEAPSSVTPDPAVIPVKPGIPSKLGTEPQVETGTPSSVTPDPGAEENPIPLFSHADKVEKESPSISALDQKQSVDKAPADSSGQKEQIIFPHSSDSTAPVLQKIEEVEEPILHPSSFKKAQVLKKTPLQDDKLDKLVPPKVEAPPTAVVPPKVEAPPTAVVPPKSVVPPKVEAPPTAVVPPKSVVPPKVETPPTAVVPPKSVVPPKVEAPPTAVVPPKSVVPPKVEAPPTAVVPPKVEAPPTEQRSLPSEPASDLQQTVLSATSTAEELTSPLLPPEEGSSLKQTQEGTYAPESEIKDLSSYLAPGSGPVVEVVVAWKERVLSVHHFEDIKKEITFGSDPKADIHCPNLVGTPIYTLLDIKQSPSIFISKGVQVSVRDHKGQYSLEALTQEGLITTYGSSQVLPLNQAQLVCLNFSSALNVYIRYANRVQKAITTGLFNFNFSEMMGIMMSFFFMSMLIFYVALFSPQFLDTTEDLESADIKKATIEFKKKPRVVKLKMANKAQKKRTKLSIPTKSKKPKKTKKVGIKKAGKQGRLGQVAAKPKAKSKKKTVTSARSGRSVHTKKEGAGPKSPRPDPTKVGLLGVFGKKGTKKVLDKAYSGAGGLAGLADQATGYAGQKEAYTGEGIGTKFKNKGAGGRGSALIGVSSGIKTKGRGGGAKGYGRGGSLGQRGMVQLALGTSDWDVAGGIDKNAILRVIRRNKHQLEWCYEFALQKRPDMEGKVLLKWDILNERVRSVKVMSNTTRDSALARCLMSRLKNFRFTGTGLQKGQIGEVRIPFAVTKR